MTEHEFCVVCGRTGAPLVDGVCAECASGRAALVTVPEHVEIVVCSGCGARCVGRHWDRAGEPPVVTATDLAPSLRVHPEVGVREVRWEERSATATVRSLVGDARVLFRGVERHVPLALDVRLVFRSCPDCSRKSGRYYTALVQLRGPSERVSEKPRDLRSRLDRSWTELLRDARPDWPKAISWREERPEGWDIYFTETLAARSIARLAKQRFGLRPVESASLFGRKDGRDVYRVTFCLRFPRKPDDDAPAAGSGTEAEPVEP
jgi:nonsense-mediated mRNA decay protein 3